VRELRFALRAYGLDLSAPAVARVLVRYDDAPDGRMDLPEFATLVLDLEEGMIRAEMPYEAAAAAAAREQVAEPDYSVTTLVRRRPLSALSLLLAIAVLLLGIFGQHLVPPPPPTPAKRGFKNLRPKAWHTSKWHEPEKA